MSQAPAGQVRLQKFLSDAGVASRRKCEELILEGRVLVNDRVVEALPAFVDPERDRVIADGVPVRPQRLEYFIVHKPRGVVCTNRDPAGRIRAIDLLPPGLGTRLFPVGRLDADSTGLLLMTNDGELAEQVTHPRYAVPKTYRAEVKGKVPRELPAQLKAGVYLAEGKATASEVEITHASHQRSVLTITLREGRNRQVRRMLARLGFRVKTLKRVQIGALRLSKLPVGAARRLTARELRELHKAIKEAAANPLAASAPKRGRKSEAPSKRPDSRRSRAADKAAKKTQKSKTSKRPDKQPSKPAKPKQKRPADGPPQRRIVT